ncbi:dehydratase [Sulfolobus sp. A20]|uniref:MaoC family dehydratase n=1 Tax=Saccharolobus sp. A20 TaxID=1891280 RepID=UPI00084621E3|nr:MaoC/PaaZ C-terminal domain-containing protein [Sulfolobus sp. A20]TRM75319.1 dehydratase [Sulfolobus sp. A20-N-F8]TRM76149.1 dehydratase [Sulfolobus sp. E5]TRM77276.1 dehydratase [Sulfolobus sp. B5]TRM81947.1 dehydratase [Sulfolobus sp. D5]TRM82780.1 dehydratase [Sulfolobus sp. A20-N-F6]TRM89527.1 dehydratase [Sulfolobus sp. C3]TRN00126.1 dehydratase [Sulfolobus sp. F1]
MSSNKSPPLTFDDFEIGMKFISPRITVTDAHIVLFAGLSGDFNPLHVDDMFAKKTIFGSRIAHGLLTVTLLSGHMGMLVAGTAMAFLEMHTKFLKPVRVGDTIYGEAEVVDKKPVEKYNGGVVTIKSRVKNQNDEVVVESESKLLVSRVRIY